MTTLLLIRHGIAEPFGQGRADAQRALTDEGRLKARWALAGLVARGYRPSRGISSPYLRARETMELFREVAEDGFPMGLWEGLTPDGDPAEVEAWLRQLLTGAGEDEILGFTSHQPLLGDLVLRLTGKALGISPASCTVVSWEGGAWHFEAHFTPDELGAGAW